MTLQMPRHLTSHERVMHNLSYHRPTDPMVMMTMEELRATFKVTATIVCNTVPLGREQSMALTAIEDACMYSIAGLARAVEVDDG